MERPRGRGRGDGCCCWPWLEKKRTTDVETKNKTAGGQAARDAPTFYCAAVGSFKQTPLHWRAGNRLTDPTGINARQAQLSSRGKALYRVPRRWRGRLCVDCLRPCPWLGSACLALLAFWFSARRRGLWEIQIIGGRVAHCGRRFSWATCLKGLGLRNMAQGSVTLSIFVNIVSQKTHE